MDDAAFLVFTASYGRKAVVYFFDSSPPGVFWMRRARHIRHTEKRAPESVESWWRLATIQELLPPAAEGGCRGWLSFNHCEAQDLSRPVSRRYAIVEDVRPMEVSQMSHVRGQRGASIPSMGAGAGRVATDVFSGVAVLPRRSAEPESRRWGNAIAPQLLSGGFRTWPRSTAKRGITDPVAIPPYGAWASCVPRRGGNPDYEPVSRRADRQTTAASWASHRLRRPGTRMCRAAVRKEILSCSNEEKVREVAATRVNALADPL